MPGFEIGTGGGGPANNLPTLRQHRWEITQLGPVTSSLDVARDLQLPNFNVEREKVWGANSTYKYAKGVDWEDVTVAFYDLFDIYGRLKKWMDTVWTPEQGLHPAGDYKMESFFKMLDSRGAVIQTFKLVNSWPVKVSHGPLSYTSSEIKYTQVTLSYDWAEFTG